MKIAHVVATFLPHIGGMGQVAFDECKKLSERGHDVTVFTLRYPGFRYDDSRWPFKVVRLRPIFKSGDAGWAPQLLFKLKNFDLVHLHYPFYGGAEWTLLAKIFNLPKYVVTYHMDARPRGFFKRAVQAVYDVLFTRAILRGAEKVMAVDKEYFASSRFGKILPSEKVVELPNAVDTEIFRPFGGNQDHPPTPSLKGGEIVATPPFKGEADGGLAELGLGDWQDKKIILFVGNLMPVKRLDLLIEAFLKINDGDARLLVVGGGYAEESYKRMVEIETSTLTLPSPVGRGGANSFSSWEKAGMRGLVQFVGAVNDRSKLAKYYSLATVLAVTSDAESFSLVIAEAMACGCLVVASDIPGIKSKIENGVNGFLFESGSAEGLTVALKKVLSLSAEERKKMGERERVVAVEKYNLERHMEKLEKIYRSLTLEE